MQEHDMPEHDRPTVLVLRALQIGDLLVAVPALRALRRAHPGHRLVLATTPALAPLVARIGGVDTLLPTPDPTIVPWSGPSPDVAVNLHGTGPQSHRALEAVGAARRIGFRCAAAGPGWEGPDWDVVATARRHERERWCALLQAVGIPADPGDLRLQPPIPVEPAGADPDDLRLQPRAAAELSRSGTDDLRLQPSAPAELSRSGTDDLRRRPQIPVEPARADPDDRSERTRTSAGPAPAGAAPQPEGAGPPSAEPERAWAERVGPRVDDQERDSSKCGGPGGAGPPSAQPEGAGAEGAGRRPHRPGPVLVHPGAAFGAKRWPPDRFAAVAAALDGPYTPVLVTGSAAERPLAAQVAAHAGLPAERVVAGRTDLGELCDLVAGAALVVSGDTGIAHLASAYGTPSVVLFGPVDPAQWGPPAGGPHVALAHPAHRRGARFADEPDPALLAIGVDEVLAAAAAVRHARR